MGGPGEGGPGRGGQGGRAAQAAPIVTSDGPRHTISYDCPCLVSLFFAPLPQLPKAEAQHKQQVARLKADLAKCKTEARTAEEACALKDSEVRRLWPTFHASGCIGLTLERE